MGSLHLVLSVLLMGLIPVPALPQGGDVPMIPSLSAPLSADAFPSRSLAASLSASGVTIVDLQSGQELFGRLAQRRRPIGSLAKVMTALLIVESRGMDEEVKIPATAAAMPGSTVRLPPGKHFTVGDLLSATLIASANDAAETLAIYHSGSADAFVAAMNDRARSLGLQDTSFSNPTGLDEPGQWSTPRDLAWLAAYALRQPQIRERMSTASAVITSREGDTLNLQHTHALLRTGSDVLAGKTGTTAAAGQCLLSLVREGGREYLVVLLGSRERYADMRAVLRVLRAFFA